MNRRKLSRRHFIEVATAGLASTYASQALADGESLDPQKVLGRFQDKVVLITGATSGIGKHCAEEYAKEGAKVFFCGRRETEGQAIQQSLEKRGLTAIYFKADVRAESEVQAFVAACVAKFGRIDVAFNNAGIYPKTDLASSPTQIHLDTLETNVNGVLFSMKYEIQQMLKQKNGGSIVNMASTAAHHAGPFTSASYCASKHAVIGLTRSAAMAYAGRNIQVNAVSPSQVQTDDRPTKSEKGKLANQAWIPVGRLCQPEEICKAVFWLTSGEASYSHGHSLILDGGQFA